MLSRVNRRHPLRALLALTLSSALVGPAPAGAAAQTASAASYAVTASPSSVGPGGSLSLSWTVSAMSSVQSGDTLGLYSLGASTTASPLASRPTNGQRTGSTSLTAPTTQGNYEVRYIRRSGMLYNMLGRSGVITVGDEPPPPPPPTASGAIRGVVLEDGSPLGGAQVALSQGPTARSPTITDSDGEYRFTGLESGAYNVTPSKSGYTIAPTSHTISVQQSEVTVPAFSASRVPPSGGSTMAGQVVLDGAPLSGVMVSVSGGSPASPAITDAQGVYQIAHLASGTYTVTPALSEHTFDPPSRSVTVAAPSVSVQTFIASTTPQSGLYQVTGNPAAVEPGETITASWNVSPFANIRANDRVGLYATGAPTTSSPLVSRPTNDQRAGSATFTAPAALGTYEFRYYRSQGGMLSILFLGRSGPVTVRIPTYAISGRAVNDIGGGGAFGITISLEGPVARSPIVTSNDGAYSFTELPRGNYTVRATKAGFRAAPPSYSYQDLHENKTEQHFTISRIRGRIFGRVVLANGTPVEAVTVAFTGGAPVLTGNDGAFNFPNLLLGTYEVSASRPGYQIDSPQSVTLTDAQPEVQVQFTAGQTNRPPTVHMPSPPTVVVGQPFSLIVTASDPDPGDEIRFTVASTGPPATITPAGPLPSPAQATVQFTATEAGTFTVSVTARDKANLAHTGTVQVTAVVNTPPRLTVPGPKTGFVGQPLSFEVSATDDDVPAEELAFTVIGGNATVVPVPPGGQARPAKATVTVTPTQTGTVSLTITVRDSRGSADTKAVTVTVEAAPSGNQRPTLTVPGPQTGTVGQLISFDVSATDPDLPAEELTFSATGATTTVQLTDSKARPAKAAIVLTPTQVGLLTLTITVSDGRGGSDSKTVAVTVQADPNQPPIPTIQQPTGPITLTLPEGQTISTPVRGRATDDGRPEGTLSSAWIAPTGSGASFSLRTKAITGTPGQPQTLEHTASAVFSKAGTFEIRFSANDTRGSVQSPPVTITVVAAGSGNQPPTLVVPDAQSARVNQPLSFLVSGSDANASDTLTLSATNLPSGALFATKTGTGSVSQLFTWTPRSVQTAVITFSVTDGKSAPVGRSVTITVEAAPSGNQPPVVTVPAAPQTVDATTLLTFLVTVVDLDPGHAEGVALTTTGLPEGAVIQRTGLSINQIGGIGQQGACDNCTTATYEFRWTPRADQAGSHTVGFTATDPGGLRSEPKTVTITVRPTGPPNLPPTLDAPVSRTIRAGEALSFIVSATDPTPADTLTLSATNLPSGASFPDKTGTGSVSQTFTWTPTTAQIQANPYVVQFKVRDRELSHAAVNVVERTTAISVTSSGAPTLQPIHRLTSNEVYNYVNFPWGKYRSGNSWTDTYGMDFGVSPLLNARRVVDNPQIQTDLQTLKSNGVEGIRWFMIPDGRNLTFNTTTRFPTGKGGELFTNDLHVALTYLSNRDMGVIFVLIDGNQWFKPEGTFQGALFGHSQVIINDAKRNAFYQTVLIPIFQDIAKWQADNPTRKLPVTAIDLINEPSEATKQFSQTGITTAHLKTYVKEAAALVHQHLPNVPVTVGVGSAQDLKANWTDGALGVTAGQAQDFYSFHHYGPEPLETLRQQHQLDQLGKRIYLQEYPTRNAPLGPVETYLAPIGGTRQGKSRAGWLSGSHMWSFNSFTSGQDTRTALEPEVIPTLRRIKAFFDTAFDPNRPPVLTNVPATITGQVGQPITFTATATDPDGDAITFSLVNPAGATIGASNGQFTWTPTQAGTVTITVKASDSKGGEATKDVIVTVTGQGSGTRTVRVKASTGAPGAQVEVPIELDAQGNERSAAFSLEFTSSILSQPTVVLGTGAANATLNVNTSRVSQGQLGITVTLPAGQTFPAGTRQIARVTFNIAVGSPSATSVNFGDSPVSKAVTSTTGQDLPTSYTAGTIMIGDPAIPIIRDIEVTENPTGALFTWKTLNIASSSQVVYDLASHATSTDPVRDYANKTPETQTAPRVTEGHEVSVSNLAPNTRYYYRVLSRSATGRLAASLEDFFITGDSDSLRITSVTIKHLVGDQVEITRVTTRKAFGQVLYDTQSHPDAADGTPPDLTLYDGGQAPSTLPLPEPEQGQLTEKITLPPLTPGVRYYFRVRVRDARNKFALSGELSFIPGEPGAIEISDVAARITDFTAVEITWLTKKLANAQVVYDERSHPDDANGQQPKPSDYRYREPADLPLPAPKEGSKRHLIPLDELEQGRRYYFRVLNRDAIDQIAMSQEYSFVPGDPAPLLIQGLEHKILGPTSAQVKWRTTKPAATQVIYQERSHPDGPNGEQPSPDAYLNRVPRALPAVPGGTGPRDHAVELTALRPGVRVYYRVLVKDAIDQIAMSDERSLAPGDATALRIERVVDIILSPTQAQITWDTNKDASSQVYYGTTHHDDEELATQTLEQLYAGSTVETHTNPRVQTHTVVLPPTSGNRRLPLQLGVRYFYRVVSIDATDQRAISLEGSFIPGDPSLYSIRDVRSKILNPTSAEIAWKTTKWTLGKVVYGTTSHSDEDLATQPLEALYPRTTRDRLVPPGPGQGFFDHFATIGRLTEGTRYYYRVVAVDAIEQFAVSLEGSFIPGDPGPLLIHGLASRITGRTAAEIAFVTSKFAVAQVIYDTESHPDIDGAQPDPAAYDRQQPPQLAPAPAPGTGATVHVIPLAELEEGTRYYYRVRVRDAIDQTAMSDERSFAPGDPAPLEIQALQSRILNAQTARITWKTTRPAAGQVVFDERSHPDVDGQQPSPDAYLSRVPRPLPPVPGGSGPMDHQIDLTNLRPGVRVYYRVLVKDAIDQIAMSDERSLAPGDATELQIAGVTDSILSSSSAQITWRTNKEASSQVHYGTTPHSDAELQTTAIEQLYPSHTPEEHTTARVTFHSVNVPAPNAPAADRLVAGTRYYYRVVSKDAIDQLAVSGEDSFIPGDPAALEIFDLTTQIVARDAVKISWKTKKLAVAQVIIDDEPHPDVNGVQPKPTEYDKRREPPELAPAPAPGEGELEHAITVSGLTEGQRYYFRVRVRDGIDQTAMSSEGSFAPGDTAELRMENVRSEITSRTSARIRWMTTRDASSQVYYGTTSHKDTEPTSLTHLAALYPTRTEELNTDPRVPEHAVDVPQPGAAELVEGTRYYYRVVSISSIDQVAISNEGTFIPGDPRELKIKTVTVEPGDDNRTRIVWETTKPVFAQVIYDDASHPDDGTKQPAPTQYDVGQEPTTLPLPRPDEGSTTGTITLPSLTNGTTYYFRLRVRDAIDQFAMSGEQGFIPGAFLTITDVNVTVTGARTATVRWKTPAQDSNSRVVYDRTSHPDIDNKPPQLSAYPSNQEPSPNPLVRDHSVDLSGLTEQACYYYRVVSKNVINQEAVSGEAGFVAGYISPAVVKNVTAAPSGNSVRIEWDTVDPSGNPIPGTSQVVYDGRVSHADPCAPLTDYHDISEAKDFQTRVTHHVINIGGLQTNHTYYFRAVSIVQNNQVVSSGEFRFTTGGQALNRAPVLTVPAEAQAVALDETLTVTVTATDPDNDTVTFSLAGNLLAGATITPTGVLTWTPTLPEHLGAHALTVTATDGRGGLDTKVVNVMVTAPGGAMRLLVDHEVDSTVGVPIYRVGEATCYTIIGATPNARVRWLADTPQGGAAVWWDPRPVDADGRWTACTGPRPQDHRGFWMLTAQVCEPTAAGVCPAGAPQDRVMFRVMQPGEAHPTCPDSGCISGNPMCIQQRFLSGPGAQAPLCAGASFDLVEPIRLTADGQGLFTQGSPTDGTRAIVRAGPGQAVAIRSWNHSNITVRNIIVDGQRDDGRPGYGHVANGGALIELGGDAGGILVEQVKAYEPKGWSALYLFDGASEHDGTRWHGGCTNVTVRNNEIGPAGWGLPDNRTWADGISFACRDSLVTGNRITDATDGAIVIFGAPGTRVEGNVIRAVSRTLLGGINMVDPAFHPLQDPTGGDYTGTVVTENTIDAASAPIQVGIAMGPQVWNCSSTTNYGGRVTRNILTGPRMRYGYAVDGVEHWTVTDNISTATHSGTPAGGCGTIPAAPVAFQRNPDDADGDRHNTFQSDFIDAVVRGVLDVH